MTVLTSRKITHWETKLGNKEMATIKVCIADYSALLDTVCIGDNVEIVGEWHDESPECESHEND